MSLIDGTTASGHGRRELNLPLGPNDAMWLTVSTGSMSPAIGVGDRVRIRAASPGTLIPGDIVAIRDGNVFIVHRFSKIEDGRIITKGDRSHWSDNAIPFDRFVGKADRIARPVDVSYLTSVSGRFRDATSHLVARTLTKYSTLHSLLARLTTHLGSQTAGKAVLKLPYRAAIGTTARFLRGVPGVQAAYLIHGAARGDIVPGLSDIDIFVVLEDSLPALYAQRRASLVNRFGFVRRFVPILGHAAILSKSEVSFLLNHGGVEAFEGSSWKLIAGEEIRGTATYPNRDLARIALFRRSLDRSLILARDLAAITNPHPSLRSLLSTRKHLIDVLRFLDIFREDSARSALQLSREEYIERTAKGSGPCAEIARNIADDFSAPVPDPKLLLRLGYRLVVEWDLALREWPRAAETYAEDIEIPNWDLGYSWSVLPSSHTFGDFLTALSLPLASGESWRMIGTHRMRDAIISTFPELLTNPNQSELNQRIGDLLFGYALSTDSVNASVLACDFLRIFCLQSYGVSPETEDDILAELEARKFPFMLEASVILSKEVSRRSFESHLAFISTFVATVIGEPKQLDRGGDETVVGNSSRNPK